MYIPDWMLRERLPDLDFQPENSGKPFDPDLQIRPASIDLRLSSVLWEQDSKGKINLTEVGARRYFPNVAGSGKTSEQVRLMSSSRARWFSGRTFEEFTVPKAFAGKIEGRSSYARLGLMVHCAAGFINPGWRGRMPLELVNLGAQPIVLASEISICQLMLIQLAELPEASYADDGANSKYMNDQGGPSLWWLDWNIEQLRESFQKHPAAWGSSTAVEAALANYSRAVVDRFDHFLSNRRVAELTNQDELLGAFAKTEDRRRLLKNVLAERQWIPIADSDDRSYRQRILQPV